LWKLAHLSCKIATRLLLSLPCCWHLLLVANGALCIVFPAHSVLRGPTPGPAFVSNLDRKYFATSLGDDACYLLLFSRIHELDGAWWTVSLIFSFSLGLSVGSLQQSSGSRSLVGNHLWVCSHLHSSSNKVSIIRYYE
jgi:hypothetical protein